jgi:dTDP-4-amino-4,6-dideoxy-D-galactose acyltransferase
MSGDMIEHLKWDSDFFGLRIGKYCLNTQSEMDELFSKRESICTDYDLVYLFSENDLQGETACSRLVDQKVIYAIEPTAGSSDTHIMEYQTGKVSTALLSLALASGAYSRFRLDGKLPKGSYDRLYQRWIELSVAHEIATEVFGYMVDGEPKGMVTLKRNNTDAIIGLVATDPQYRGKGIGRSMLEHVKNYCLEQNIRKLTVATQKQNLPACRMYEKAGFTVESCTNIWHWWLQ